MHSCYSYMFGCLSVVVKMRSKLLQCICVFVCFTSSHILGHVLRLYTYTHLKHLYIIYPFVHKCKNSFCSFPHYIFLNQVYCRNQLCPWKELQFIRKNNICPVWGITNPVSIYYNPSSKKYTFEQVWSFTDFCNFWRPYLNENLRRKFIFFALGRKPNMLK